MSENEGPRAARGPAPVVRGRRSAAGEIRERLPWIEEQLRAGHSLAQIAVALREAGVPINHLNLKQSLYRARKEAGGRAASRAPGEGQSGREVAVPAGLLAIAPSAAGTSGDGGASLPPPKAAVEHLSFEEAMDPQKRAAFADQFLKKKPLVIQPKRKRESEK